MKKFLKIMLIPLALLLLYLGAVLCIQFFYLMGATTGPRIDPAANTRCALLVIDVQNMYTYAEDPQKAARYKIDALISNINTAIDRLKGGCEVIFITQVADRFSFVSILMPTIPAKGSKEAGVNPALRGENRHLIIKYRGDAFSNPELQRYLNEKKVGTLYVTGLASEVCVNYTIQGALNRGYRVNAIGEAIWAMFGEESGRKMLSKFEKLGAKTVPLAELGI